MASKRAAPEGRARPKAREMPKDLAKFLQGKRPERSIYYDPVMNPYGAPPPGMPYKERSPTPEEDEDAAYAMPKRRRQEHGDADDEVVMPTKPKPATEKQASSGKAEAKPAFPTEPEDASSDDEIAMPAGPPPGARAPAAPVVPPAHVSQRPGALSKPSEPLRKPPQEIAAEPVRYEPPAPAPAPAPASTPKAPAATPHGVQSHATVLTAEPQLRKLDQSTTSFVPPSVRRRQQRARP